MADDSPTMGQGRPASELELTGEEYQRATLYFREPLKDEYEDWLNMREVDTLEIKNSERREVHEAIISVAMQHTDEIVEELEEMSI